MAYSAKQPWRDRCPQLHDAVAKIHAVLTAEDWRQEIRDLPRQIEARRKQWSDYETDWEQRRIKYYEEVVATTRSMRDPDQDLWDTHCWDILSLPLTAADAKEILKTPLYQLFHRNVCRTLSRPGMKPYVREVYLEGWVLHDLSTKDNMGFYFVPPVVNAKDLTRPHDRLEILATLVFIHDADGDFPPLIPKSDSLVIGVTKNLFDMRRMFGRADDTWAKPLGAWLDSLDPETGDTETDDPPSPSDTNAMKWGVASLEDIPERVRSFPHTPEYIVETVCGCKKENPAEFLRGEMAANRLRAFWPKHAKKLVVDITCFPADKHMILLGAPPDNRPSDDE